MIVQKKNSYGRQVVADTMAEAAVGSGGHNGSSSSRSNNTQDTVTDIHTKKNKISVIYRRKRISNSCVCLIKKKKKSVSW